MGLPVLILGRSGSGKSRSIKNMTDVAVIKAVNKVLPFRAEVKNAYVNDYRMIKALLNKGDCKSYVIDDAGYLMTDEFTKKKDE